ncbi:MAG: hypothetical protein IMZ43_04220 [Thermoplasmata archaeon]|nr:hypothetical protein [Thermoplasmata archaeon]MBE3136585.1 hypothetical protein [Thermoplasmata archaeon]MBE3139485.1 hypothetical protein [Thermoplasmata archaeon]
MIRGKLIQSWIVIISVVILFMATSIFPYAKNISRAQPTQNEPPVVSIINPEAKNLYFRDIHLFPSARTLIFGFITIKANANDDTGIKQVDFYIDGVLRNTSFAPHHCGSYMWVWNDRALFRSRHTIKVIAVDTDGLTAEDTCDVSLHNFPFLHPLYP